MRGLISIFVIVGFPLPDLSKPVAGSGVLQLLVCKLPELQIDRRIDTAVEQHRTKIYGRVLFCVGFCVVIPTNVRSYVRHMLTRNQHVIPFLSR